MHFIDPMATNNQRVSPLLCLLFLFLVGPACLAQVDRTELNGSVRDAAGRGSGGATPPTSGPTGSPEFRSLQQAEVGSIAGSTRLRSPWLAAEAIATLREILGEVLIYGRLILRWPNGLRLLSAFSFSSAANCLTCSNGAQYGPLLADLSDVTFSQIISTVNTGPMGTG